MVSNLMDHVADVLGLRVGEMMSMELAGSDLPVSSNMEEASALTPQRLRPLPTGVVTFLLSDVEGSTRLWEGDEEAMAAAIARHYDLLDAAVALHGGIRPLEQGEGDSVVGVFAKPADAIAAALDAQRAFAEEPWPQGGAIKVRIALHTGEARLRDDDSYLGPASIRCARLREIAHGGQTLLSGATRELVTDRLPPEATLQDLGVHRSKDLGRPERAWQLCHPDLGSEFPPLRSLDAVVNNLPLQLTSFVGRHAELAELRRVLADSRLVTLTGAGGCGKTRLALHAAADLVEHHPDGVRWIDLGPVSNPELVAHAVARTFGFREENRPLIETLSEQLARLDALLVFDNCEHLLGASARLIESLLQAAPALRVVATSREPLGLAGETTWRVPSLDDQAATQLFVERAVQVRPDFAADPGEREVVTQICRRLDGIALAIELAAARTRMMPLAGIAAGLDDRFRLLTGGGRNVLPRQHTLEASVAWSHDLLDDGERALLRRLSVFAGGFTLDAAEEVGAGGLLDRYAVLDVLSHLVDKSLVQVDFGDAEGRYRLLETIRLYARQRLVEAGESHAVWDRHLAFFLALAERAEPELAAADGPVWLDRLEREHDNLRAALQWADTTGASESALRLVTALALFFEWRGHLAEGGRWFARALARHEQPSALRARALWGAAHVAIYGGDHETVARRAPEALDMARAVSDRWATGRALNSIGLLQCRTDPDRARGTLQESVDLGRGIGDGWAVADGWKMITLAWMYQDDYQGLAPALEELRLVAEGLDSKFFIAWYHGCAGWADVHRGEFETARAALEIAFEYCQDLGDPAIGGIIAALLGEIEARTGQWEAAETRLHTFLQHAAATGAGLGVGWALSCLAPLALGRGDPAAAHSFAVQLLESPRAYFRSWGLSALGAAHLAAGDDRRAGTILTNARDIGTSIGNPRLIAQADHHLASLARHRGDTTRAEDLAHQALVLRAKAGLRPGIAESLEALGGLAADHQSDAEATRLLAAAATQRAAMGLVRWPADQDTHNAALIRLRQTLGDREFEATWTEGEALSTEEAIAYASRWGERKRPSTGWASLTPTELDVAKLLTKGLTNPQVAQRLFIGRGTVKTHIAHILAKLGMSSRAEVAAEATRRGL